MAQPGRLRILAGSFGAKTAHVWHRLCRIHLNLCDAQTFRMARRTFCMESPKSSAATPRLPILATSTVTPNKYQEGM
jgi:hypothetical protein